MVSVTDKIDHIRLTVFCLAIFIGISLTVKLVLVFQLPVNQDEFFHLSKIFDYKSGRLHSTSQNFHVLFFQWIPLLKENEVVLITICRMVMFLFLAGACMYIFLIGKLFLNVTGALFAVLCYLSFLFSVINGAAFRSDTVPIFLFLFALYRFILKPTSYAHNVIPGIAMAAATMFTIKTGIYLPVFMAVFATDLLTGTSKCVLPRTSFFFAYICSLAILHYSFDSLLQTGSVIHDATTIAGTMSGFSTNAGNAYSTFISLDNFFPQIAFFTLSLKYDWHIWLFLAMGFLLNLHAIKQKINLRHGLYLLIMFIPMLSPLFYRNAFPYFYVFISPTATLLCGYALFKLTEKTGKHETAKLVLITLVCCIMGSNTLGCSLVYSKKQTGIQEQTLALIHELFPEPTAYIDGCSMVSSFPKAGFFMSSAGMRWYLRNNRPVMENLLYTRQPRFLIANVSQLDLTADLPPLSDTGLALSQGDWETLKTNFVHHWGSVWLAGKRFDLRKGPLENNFNIIIQGIYTVESVGQIAIDGRTLRPGETIYLSRGDHCLMPGEISDSVTLKWGDNPLMPDKSPSSPTLFSGNFL